MTGIIMRVIDFITFSILGSRVGFLPFPLPVLTLLILVLLLLRFFERLLVINMLPHA